MPWQGDTVTAFQNAIDSVTLPLIGAPGLMLLSPSAVGKYSLSRRFSMLSAILVLPPGKV